MSSDASYPDSPVEFVRDPPIDAETLHAGIEYFGVRTFLTPWFEQLRQRIATLGP